MNVLDFQKRLKAFTVFSLQDARKAASHFSYRQIDRWAKAGYLQKIRRGYFLLAEQQRSTSLLFVIANKIYTPSYVSLERAMKYYGFLPEEVFQITSISTKKTAKFATPLGQFSYRHLHPRLFFGYQIIHMGDYSVLMAEPEKAVLDYLYLHPRLKTVDDFLGMRINAHEFLAVFDTEKFQRYLSAFGSAALSKRAAVFLSAVHHDKS